MYRFAQLRYIRAFVLFEKWPILMAAAFPWLVTAGMVEGMDVFVLGSSFTEEEKSELALLIASLNSAAVKYLHQSRKFCDKAGVHVSNDPDLGGGLFSGKHAVKDGVVAVYIGTLEVKTRYIKAGGRLDYAMALQKLKVGDVYLDIILCGYEKRDTPLNAVMINHTCTDAKINTKFELVQIDLYADVRAVQKKRRMEESYERMYGGLGAADEKVVFSYPIVVAKVCKPVPAGGQFLVSYNQPMGDAIDHRWNYFVPEDIARKECGRNEVLCPCMCEPSGCPFKRFFLRRRDLVSPPP